jgi:hypothetical protein
LKPQATGKKVLDWTGILELINEGNHSDAYRRVLEGNDEIMFIKLMGRTGKSLV